MLIKPIFGGSGASVECTAGPFYPYEINNSVRRAYELSTSIHRTPTVTGNRTTFTYSMWVKRSNISIQQILMTQTSTVADVVYFTILADNSIRINNGDLGDINLVTTQKFRDTSSWYHFVVAVDTTQSTASNRVKLYVNGEQVTAFSTATYPAQNWLSYANTSGYAQYVGNGNSGGVIQEFDGYMADVYLIDGQALTPDNFGEFKQGVWIPSTYTGSYGTNGFFLEFNGNLNDSSGNGNNFSNTGITAHDYVKDSPTNNFALFNINSQYKVAGSAMYTAGVRIASPYNNQGHGNGNISFNSGKWYFEGMLSNASATVSSYVGIFSVDSTKMYLYSPTGQYYNGSSWSSYGSSYTSGDKIGVAIDADNRTIEFFKNGVSQGVKTGIIIDSSIFRVSAYILNGYANGYINSGGDCSFGGVDINGGNYTDANGIGEFYYEPPGGYLALCTKNLEETEISPNTCLTVPGQIVDYYNYNINKSLRFDASSNTYLNRTPASQTNTQTWTYSTWIKRANISLPTGGLLLGGWVNSGQRFMFQLRNTDKLWVYGLTNAGNTITVNIETAQLFKDTSDWHHIVLAMDTTNATASERVRIYVDGVRATVTGTQPAQNTNFDINKVSTHTIGYEQLNGRYFDGYLAETHFIDGQVLTADDFGEFNYGRWIPKAYAGTYGTNGFYLNYSNGTSTTTLGYDASANSNNWTLNNFSTYDQVEDTATNNYPLISLNTLATNGTIQRGALESNKAGGGHKASLNIPFPKTGKWYAELMIFNSTGTNCYFGLSDGLGNFQAVNNTALSYIGGLAVAIAFDADSGTAHYYYESAGSLTADGTDVVSMIDDHYFAVYQAAGINQVVYRMNPGQDGTFAGSKTASYTDENGQGNFYFQPPAGYLALCAENLGDNQKRLYSAADGSNFFNPVIYAGNSTNGHAINGVGFQPDLVWIKARNVAFGHLLYDSTRGANTALRSNEATSEQTYGNTLTSFDSDGFTLGDDTAIPGGVNGSGYNYVAWCWKSNGTPVSNTAGTITSSVSANTTSGFSIVSYTGNGVSGSTVGHGLSEKPELIIIKDRDSGSYQWLVYAEPMTATKYALLNSSSGPWTNSSPWNNTEPNNEVFTIGTSTFGNNATNDKHIAYCWHSVDGFSKIGKYTGNGSTDGTFVHTGFKPAYLLIRNISATGWWTVHDSVRATYNTTESTVSVNVNNVETSSYNHAVDFLSNGFKLREVGQDQNSNGHIYIYMAIAEDPFKYENAK